MKITEDYKLEDWTKTPLFDDYKNKGKHEFNVSEKEDLFTEEENNYIYILIKQRYESEMQYDGIILSFFTKAQNTFRELMCSFGLQAQYLKIKDKYDERSIDDTLKLLIRNSLLFKARNILFEVYDLL